MNHYFFILIRWLVLTKISALVFNGNFNLTVDKVKTKRFKKKIIQNVVVVIVIGGYLR